MYVIEIQGIEEQVEVPDMVYGVKFIILRHSSELFITALMDCNRVPEIPHIVKPVISIGIVPPSNSTPITFIPMSPGYGLSCLNKIIPATIPIALTPEISAPALVPPWTSEKTRSDAAALTRLSYLLHTSSDTIDSLHLLISSEWQLL